MSLIEHRVTWCQEHGYITSHDGFDHALGYCPVGDHHVAATDIVPAEQLRGAVDLVRALGSGWRANDDEAISNALAQLEDEFGLREQGR